jgi:hypothetical protein
VITSNKSNRTHEHIPLMLKVDADGDLSARKTTQATVRNPTS